MWTLASAQLKKYALSVADQENHVMTLAGKAGWNTLEWHVAHMKLEEMQSLEAIANWAHRALDSVAVYRYDTPISRMNTGTGGGDGGGGDGDGGDYTPDVVDKRNLRSVRTMSRGKSMGSDDDDIPDIADERNLLRSVGTIPQLSSDDDIPDIAETRNLV